jgi:hypothetical protein
LTSNANAQAVPLLSSLEHDVVGSWVPQHSCSRLKLAKTQQLHMIKRFDNKISSAFSSFVIRIRIDFGWLDPDPHTPMLIRIQWGEN